MSSTECPSGFKEINGKFCFAKGNGMKNFFDAKAACEQLGGFLAEPRSDEISHVITFFEFQSDFFIGLRKLSNGGDFHWQTDNAGLSYADWDYMEPDNFRGNNLCVRINNNYKWEDSHCYIKNYYLCQAKL